MDFIFQAFIAGGIVASLSLLGIVFFGKNTNITRGAHRFVLPGAVGVFLGVVFFELIPETIEASHEWGPAAIVFGFLGFYLLSHYLDTFHSHHEHEDTGEVKKSARMLLIGDAIHNTADGIVIASAFMINPFVGIITTVGIALHEIPQEIAEFGVLIQSGYSRKKALLYNALSALSILLGIALTYLLAQPLGAFLFVLTGIAAGNLLYIATADLIPELLQNHKEHFLQTFLATLSGVVIIAVLITYTHSFIDEEIEGHEGDMHELEHAH